MKHRSPIAVFFLPFVTFGIYGLVWEVKTKVEMKRLGADIPTAWLIIVPIINIYWLWKYSMGVEKVTNEKISGIMAFVLLILLGPIGMAIIQNDFNNVAASGSGGQPAPATGTQMAAAQPDNSFGGPAAPAPQSGTTPPRQTTPPQNNSNTPPPPLVQ